MPTLRFRAEPNQAANLQVRVYSQDRSNLLTTVTTGIAESIAGSGSYACTIPNLNGYWYVLVNFVDTGEVTSDGFASQWVPEVVDYLPPNSGLGQHAVTILVTSNAQPVATAQVTIRKNSEVVAWGTTNVGGEITFALNADTYSVLVQTTSPLYSPLAPQTLVVTTSASTTYQLVQQTIDPPAIAGLTQVRFLVLDAGQPVENARVQVELDTDNPTVDTALVSRASRYGITDSAGLVDLTMIQKASFTRGGTYRITVTDSMGRRLHSRRVTVPTVATIYAEDLPDAT